MILDLVRGFSASPSAQQTAAAGVFCSVMLAGLILAALNWEWVELALPIVGALSGLAILVFGAFMISKRVGGDKP